MSLTAGLKLGDSTSTEDSARVGRAQRRQTREHLRKRMRGQAGNHAVQTRLCWLLTERLISLWVDLPCQRRLTNDDWSPTSSRRIYPSSRPYGGQMRLLMSATCHYWFSWISQGQKRLTMGPSLSAAQRAQV